MKVVAVLIPFLDSNLQICLSTTTKKLAQNFLVFRFPNSARYNLTQTIFIFGKFRVLRIFSKKNMLSAPTFHNLKKLREKFFSGADFGNVSTRSHTCQNYFRAEVTNLIRLKKVSLKAFQHS